MAKNGVKERLVSRRSMLKVLHNALIRFHEFQYVLARVSRQSPPGVPRVWLQTPQMPPMVTLGESKLCQCPGRETANRLIGFEPQPIDLGKRRTTFRIGNPDYIYEFRTPVFRQKRSDIFPTPQRIVAPAYKYQIVILTRPVQCLPYQQEYGLHLRKSSPVYWYAVLDKVNIVTSNSIEVINVTLLIDMDKEVAVVTR